MGLGQGGHQQWQPLHGVHIGIGYSWRAALADAARCNSSVEGGGPALQAGSPPGSE